MEEISRKVQKVLDLEEKGLCTPYEAANEIEWLVQEIREWADKNYMPWFLELGYTEAEVRYNVAS